MTITIKNGTKSVAIYSNDSAGPFSSRLWVNCTPGASRLDGDATLLKASHKTLEGAKKWADKTLAA